MDIIKKNWSFILFVFLTLFFSFFYVGYIYSNGGLGYVEDRTIMGEFGKSLGTLGGIMLVLVYSRSILKIIVGNASFWKNLEPLSMEQLDLKKWSVKFLVLLNKTHAYFGILAIVFIFMHCYLTGSYRDNLLLQIVLVLMAVEGISGLILKFKYLPTELKRKSYLIHRKFVIGMILLILTILGHLILGN